MGHLGSECSCPFLTDLKFKCYLQSLPKRSKNILDPEGSSNPSGFCNYAVCWPLTKLLVATAL